MSLKRNVIQTQNSPTRAHRWSPELMEKRKLAEWNKQQQRFTDLLHLVEHILLCRTSRGKVGLHYQQLRDSLNAWKESYSRFSNKEWVMLKQVMQAHNFNPITAA